MKKIFLLIILAPLLSIAQDSARRTINFPRQEVRVTDIPAKEQVWVFIMAGQSNMAGRGLVESEDTISHSRILTINRSNELIEAKEPLHFYQPKLTGLDCGMSFARNLLDKIDSNIYILLLPTAVGGSSIKYWLNDSVFNGVHLKTNFMEKVDLAKRYGILKGILWHQGESDATMEKIPGYEKNLQDLLSFFRSYSGNPSLPIILGELGSYTVKEEMRHNWSRINEIIRKTSGRSTFNALVETGDLKPREDNIHFDGPSQRLLGQRYAAAFLKSFLQNN